MNKNFLPMKKSELKSLTEQVIEISALTGKKLLSYQKKISSLTIDHKKAQGVVSEADVEAEKYIIKKLKKILPEASFLAEESSYLAKDIFTKDSEALLWVIDPLDGTTNFLNNMDYYAVCISLCYYGQPIIGVVHRPRTGETYFSFQGGGSYILDKKGRKKKLSSNGKPAKNFKDCLLATGFATEKGIPFDIEFDIFKSMMSNCRGVRRMGSAALDLCLTAEGIFDGFWERGLAPWDTAAASLICLEAGQFITDYSGEVFSPFNKTIVCGPKFSHKTLLKMLK